MRPARNGNAWRPRGEYLVRRGWLYIADFGGGEQQRAAARCWLRTLRGTAVLPGLRAADGQGELTWRDQTCPARASRLP
jgi:hypothetical protein